MRRYTWAESAFCRTGTVCGFGLVATQFGTFPTQTLVGRLDARIPRTVEVLTQLLPTYRATCIRFSLTRNS